MGYLSEKGKLAGPIQINGNSVDDNNKIWLFSKHLNGDDALLCYAQSSYSQSGESFKPIYASTPASLPSEGSSSSDWLKFDNAVATIGWVRSNFTSNTGVAGFSPDDYVKKETYNALKAIVDNNIIRIQSLETKTAELDSIKNRVSALENNPYPDGVIFVAGTAAEVV